MSQAAKDSIEHAGTFGIRSNSAILSYSAIDAAADLALAFQQFPSENSLNDLPAPCLAIGHEDAKHGEVFLAEEQMRDSSLSRVDPMESERARELAPRPGDLSGRLATATQTALTLLRIERRHLRGAAARVRRMQDVWWFTWRAARSLHVVLLPAIRLWRSRAALATRSAVRDATAHWRMFGSQAKALVVRLRRGLAGCEWHFRLAAKYRLLRSLMLTSRDLTRRAVQQRVKRLSSLVREAYATTQRAARRSGSVRRSRHPSALKVRPPNLSRRRMCGIPPLTRRGVQDPPVQPLPCIVLTGHDVGFRLEGYSGSTPAGRIVVKVNGQWVEPNLRRWNTSIASLDLADIAAIDSNGAGASAGNSRPSKIARLPAEPS